MMTQGVPWPISYAVFTIGMFVIAWLTYIILRYYEKPRKQRRAGKIPPQES
jgi:magnesium transporter